MKTQSRTLLAALLSAGFIAIAAESALAQAVIVERPMPAPLVETIPVAPGATFKWVPGHWVWRGMEWVWAKGHYVENVMVPPMPAPVVEIRPPQPSPQHFWVRGHYGWDNDRWNWRPGAWFRP